ncbi:hypothetical protein [Dubosiella newyorkensis]|uniref:hypothetical protein n=1 Tax=Dubosiella newyorkensis TaxID=1862672 RepID=UPI002583957C|nr:hypothetical protein [Dubosiella newyorkensis]
MSKNKHLDRNDRTIILRGIVERSPRTSVALTLRKDSSTIAKEIRLHRLTIPPKKFQIAKNLGGPIVHCAIKDCIHIQDGSCPLHRKTQNSKCFEPYGIDRFSTCRAVHPDFPGTILQFHDRASVHRKNSGSDAGRNRSHP